MIAKNGTPAEKAINTVCQAIHGIGGVVLALMMLLTATDVIGRYLFNRPFDGSTELNEVMLAIVVFFGVAYTATQKGHVRVEILVSALPPKARMLLDALMTFLGFGLFSLMSWQAVVLAIDQWNRDLTTSVLYIPVFPFALVVAFGSVLLGLVSLVHFFETMGQVVRTRWKTLEWLIPLVILLLLISTVTMWLHGLSPKMTPMNMGFIGMGMMLLLLFLGMPIGFAMSWVGFVGMLLLVSQDAGLTLIKTVQYNTATTYSLSVVPLFILMGAFAFHTGLSKDLYLLVYRWLGHMPGGLAMATVGGCAGFAAVSGSSLATAATMGMVALPEMERYKYDPALATGCIAAGGSIGILIPPSVVLIIYGILTNQPIGKLFIAGFIPGILEAVFYIITIYILCKRRPEIGPPGEKSHFKERMLSIKDTWGALVLFVLVIGGLYLGIFTPTEAGGVGAFGALIFTLLRKKLNLKNFFSSLNDSLRTTAMAFIILIGAMLLGYFLTVTQLPFELAQVVASLEVNRYIILGCVLLIFMVLGCVMDSLSIVLLTIPIFFPVITALEFDPIWFGIVVVRVVEIGMITPPVGVNVFIIKGVAKDVPMYTIFRGILPFLMADICHVGLLLAVPQITLFLPNLI
jgi:tripartite ATP-independent transporter DctM subunit